jgi:hypothetical protein
MITTNIEQPASLVVGSGFSSAAPTGLYSFFIFPRRYGLGYNISPLPGLVRWDEKVNACPKYVNKEARIRPSCSFVYFMVNC